MTSALTDCRVVYPRSGRLDDTAFIDDIIQFPFARKVDISVTRVLSKGMRLFDPDSILRGNCKQLLDVIVDAGILVDDSHRFVGRVLGRQDAGHRESGPAIVLTFWESPDDECIDNTRPPCPRDPPKSI